MATNQCVLPAKTPGPTGINDQGDPSKLSCIGQTPGPTGLNDYGEQVCTMRTAYSPRPATNEPADESLLFSENSVSGSVLIGAGAGAVVQIPVPGTNGLHIGLTPNNFKGKSTSTLFIQDVAGKKHLRLDYGPNVATGKIDYHWNQKGTYAKFGIKDHQTVGKSGEVLYKGAKYFKYAGRVLIVVGVVADAYGIYTAKKRLRKVTTVVAGWGGAVAGCYAGGWATGAVMGAGGSVVPGAGTAAGAAVGGIGGCIVGGVAGAFGASWAAGEVYDWVEETYFEEVPEIKPPASLFSQ